MYQRQAIETIHKAIIPQGIMATAMVVDNYASVWSRDSMMTGIAGLLANDIKIIDGYKQSIETLAEYQNKDGQIPSNVSFTDGQPKISYGSLVGRVDATTWWIVGACIYILNLRDEELKSKLENKVSQALNILNAWEINGRGLIYTPLGGNWADEYITSGYTLYDNALRYWALSLAGTVYNHQDYISKADRIKQLIISNFNIASTDQPKYHMKAYEELKLVKPSYLPLSLSANGYNLKWDMAGNALAIILGLNTNIDSTIEYLKGLNKELNHWMLPVFYPAITENDWEWNLLKNNYSYNFKNHPYHFHNGGSWPIFLGWLSLGLRANGEEEIPAKILENYENLLTENQPLNFNEYWTSNKLEPKGTNSLCFSACGYLMMKSTNNDIQLI